MTTYNGTVLHARTHIARYTQHTHFVFTREAVPGWFRVSLEAQSVGLCVTGSVCACIWDGAFVSCHPLPGGLKPKGRPHCLYVWCAVGEVCGFLMCDVWCATFVREYVCMKRKSRVQTFRREPDFTMQEKV